jgi:hypothetical protein
MNTDQRACQRRFVNAAAAAAMLAALILLVAACGSSPSDGTAAAAGQEQGIEFAQCMRDNGVPDFPDPDPDGQLRGLGHEERGDPKFSAAMETCRQKLPGGGDHR